jgi:DNA polymerase III alpha subunit
MKIADIQKHITYFSEELRQKCKHEEEVTVGGIIQSIVPPINDETDSMYIVVVDDLVGALHVMVPVTMMEHYKGKFQIGEFIVVNGFVNVVSRSHKKDISVFAYDLKDIAEEESISS